MKILNCYYSATGNTEKVAAVISKTAKNEGHTVETVKITENSELLLLDYDLVFAGSGIYYWLPGEPLMKVFKKHLKAHVEQGAVRPGAPRLKDKNAVIYCTYGGAHTGIREALPAVKYLGQLFDHLGFNTIGEWYVVGEYIPESFKTMSVEGRLGDIRGRPNEADLRDVTEKVKGLLRAL